MTRPANALKPFWRYYGGKWRAAPHYPPPLHDVIVEPFAGAAGYSCNYPDHKVVLVEKYPVVAAIWRYLIAVSAAEVRRIPVTDDVDALPAWVPQEARWLVGFWMHQATSTPRKRMSSMTIKKRAQDGHGNTYGWTSGARERVASQVDRIRHWLVHEGDWWEVLDVPGTWFVDPPYANRAGSFYARPNVDHAALGDACKALQARGSQVIACENAGATWLPFRELFTPTQTPRNRRSAEAIWP